MSLALVLELTLACAAASAGATGLVLLWLRRRGILDHPNGRSSHTDPTPRGGGLAVVPVVAITWSALAILDVVPPFTLLAVCSALGLGYVGWQDDRGGLRVRWRLLAQFAAIAVGLVGLPGAGHIFQGLLPAWLDLLATAVLWAWFVNLFNFMDGIDGITGAESVALGLGVALVAWTAVDPETGGLPLGLALAAAAAGFLPWNWHPAKIFLGDVGSVPLGYLGAWLLFGLAGRGHWAPALILPLYYLADATLTLLYRAVRGRKLWEAHREHFYQRAVQFGLGHGSVVLRIFIADAGLVVLALIALWWPWVGLALAIVLVVALIVLLMRRPADEAAPPG